MSLNSCFGCLLDRFLIEFGIDLGVILEFKIDQISMSKFDRFLDASWEGSGVATSHLRAINS